MPDDGATGSFPAGQIFLGRDGKTFGPYTPPQLEEMRLSGEINRFHWLWDGSGQWIAANPPPPPPPMAPESHTSTELVRRPIDRDSVTNPSIPANIPTAANATPLPELFGGSLELTPEESTKPLPEVAVTPVLPPPLRSADPEVAEPSPATAFSPDPSKLFDSVSKETVRPAAALPPQFSAPPSVGHPQAHGAAKAKGAQAQPPKKAQLAAHADSPAHVRLKKGAAIDVRDLAGIRAVCLHERTILNGTLLKASADGCVMVLGVSLIPRRSGLTPGRSIVLNLVDEPSGRSENVRVILSSGQRREGKLELMLHWDRVPQLLALGA